MTHGYPFKTLPDYLRPGLDLVLVGINPGVNSVVRGHYFSSPWSRFWPAFSRSRLSAPIRQALGVERLSPEHDTRLLEFGIGLTDVVKRPTLNASGLTPRDFAHWAPRLRHRLQRAAPQVACFHGVTAYANFLRFGLERSPAGLVLGPQRERLDAIRLFVLPNPSGANAHVTPSDLTRWYDRLADFLATSRRR
ncbi:MAG: mismatch-specific DNA-glycosylase [Candidatus Rokuibacteriota bacterium]